MYNFDFSSSEYEHFKNKCGFTPEEEYIFTHRRIGDKSVGEMCYELSISPKTFNRRIKSILRKIRREL